MYPITPQHIDTRDHFFGTFGEYHQEISGRVLVRLAQKNGSWRDFSKKELDEFHNEDVTLNGLDVGPDPYIRNLGNGTYRFTHKFITTCFLHQMSSDNTEAPHGEKKT